MAAGVLYPTMTESTAWNAVPAQADGMFLGTPEIYFSKRIDNSRLIKIADPKRRREMLSLGFTLAVLFLLVTVYVWQHFSAIEYGYKIEQLKSERDAIAESTRTLGLEEASLKDVSRIARLANEMGMQPPVDGQWQPMNNGAPDPATPIMAKANGIMVVSGMQ
ncbi:MAG TPA: cell division protein FtsL [Terriglobales bacterium]|nr:cell division protein FtsL [Terriglobales bacterium]